MTSRCPASAAFNHGEENAAFIRPRRFDRLYGLAGVQIPHESDKPILDEGIRSKLAKAPIGPDE
jgi:hypothetical protein